MQTDKPSRIQQGQERQQARPYTVSPESKEQPAAVLRLVRQVQVPPAAFPPPEPSPAWTLPELSR